MADLVSRQYGKPTRPFRGSGRRPVLRLRTRAELTLDERMQARFRAARVKAGTAPSRAFQEVCEGNQKPWAAPSRRALEMLADGRLTIDEIVELCSLDRGWLEEQAVAARHLKLAA